MAETENGVEPDICKFVELRIVPQAPVVFKEHELKTQLEFVESIQISV